MFAIVETGGKQFRVEEGYKFKVEKIDAEAGSDVDLEKVLLINDGSDVKVGAPFIDQAKVTCEVVEHGRGKKVVIFKKRRRKDSRCKTGHRQDYTMLMVKTINA